MMLMAFAQLEGFDFMRAVLVPPLQTLLQVRLPITLCACQIVCALRHRPGASVCLRRVTCFYACAQTHISHSLRCRVCVCAGLSLSLSLCVCLCVYAGAVVVD
jgi:hypothetical protein